MYNVGQLANTNGNKAKIQANSGGHGLQQLVVQPGQKLLIGHNTQGQRVFIKPAATAQQQQQQPQQQQTVTPSIQVLNQNQPSSTAASNSFVMKQAPVAQQTPTIGSSLVTTNQSQPQKVIQQIVNTSNIQQHILVGGQRIILSPGQTIVTQRSLSVPANQQQQQIQVLQNNKVQQQSIDDLQRQTTTHIQTAGVNNSVVTSLQQQCQISKQVKQEITHPPPPENNAHLQDNTRGLNAPANQQIVVQNSTLAQQLAQGKLQVATINGQQVIIKPLGNNQAQIVAHIKTQSDGNAHIVTNSVSDIADDQAKTISTAVQLQVIKF